MILACLDQCQSNIVLVDDCPDPRHTSLLSTKGHRFGFLFDGYDIDFVELFVNKRDPIPANAKNNNWWRQALQDHVASVRVASHQLLQRVL